jgi:hypothetical protein
VADKGWQREFEDPIGLRDGRTLVTLRDAATYVTGPPKREYAKQMSEDQLEKQGNGGQANISAPACVNFT